MRQFIDYFTNLQQWNAGEYIAGLALITMFLMAGYGLIWIIEKACGLYVRCQDEREE